MNKYKTKLRRYNFVFDEKSAELMDKLVKETDMTFTKIVIRAVEDFAKKKGVKND